MHYSGIISRGGALTQSWSTEADGWSKVTGSAGWSRRCSLERCLHGHIGSWEDRGEHIIKRLDPQEKRVGRQRTTCCKEVENQVNQVKGERRKDRA